MQEQIIDKVMKEVQRRIESSAVQYPRAFQPFSNGHFVLFFDVL